MLQKQMEKYIASNVLENEIQLFDFEELYARKLGLLPEGISVTTKSFFYETIERCNKETEDVIAKEQAGFLNEPLVYLKNHAEEFLFVGSDAFELIGIDGIAMEYDDVFGTYTALFGLKLQKKYGPAIKEFLDENLHGEGAKYSVMFSGEDGLWDMNFALDHMADFDEIQSIQQSIVAVYNFVFKLAEAVEDGK